MASAAHDFRRMDTPDARTALALLAELVQLAANFQDPRGVHKLAAPLRAYIAGASPAVTPRRERVWFDDVTP
jgi:hypothetical protein